MDHASQRLFERSAAAEAERGFALLRDRKALQGLIERGTRGLPRELDRVAIPLAEGFGDDPPRIIVTREGHGVTCLARGMAANVPALSWDDVAQHLRIQQDRVRRGRAQSRLEEDESLAFAFEHGCVHGHRMTRAEWEDLRTLAPLLMASLDYTMNNTVELLAGHRKHAELARRMGPEITRSSWGLYVGACHLVTATAGESRTFRQALRSAAVGDVLLAARGFHILVNHPERTFELVRELIKDRLPGRVLMRFILTIIAWRFSWHRDEALALDNALDSTGEVLERHRAEFMDVFVRGKAIEYEVLRCVPALFAERMGPETAGDFDGVMARITAAGALLRDGATVEDAAESVGPWMRAVIDAWRPFERAFQEPRKVLLPGPPDEAAARSWELWRKAQVQSALAIGMRTLGLGAVFSCAPLEALIPGDTPDPAWSSKNGARYIRDQLHRVLKTGEPDDPPRQQPVRKEPTAGRNEPCPCGSGKKFKKCCGGA